MTLDDWLKQDRNLADQLKVIEGLCSALNQAHDAIWSISMHKLARRGLIGQQSAV